MHHILRKAWNLLVDKWYVHQYVRTSKTNYQPEEKIWWENRKRNRSDKIPRARVRGLQLIQLVRRNPPLLDLLFLIRSTCHLLFSKKKFVYECITSILLLEQERTIYSMIKDMCLSVWRHQRHIIDKKKNMMENQIRNKNDKIPRARIWTLTTDCNMVQSNALPTELRGTCQHLRFNLNSCFRLSMHCKDQAKK